MMAHERRRPPGQAITAAQQAAGELVQINTTVRRDQQEWMRHEAYSRTRLSGDRCSQATIVREALDALMDAA